MNIKLLFGVALLLISVSLVALEEEITYCDQEEIEFYLQDDISVTRLKAKNEYYGTRYIKLQNSGLTFMESLPNPRAVFMRLQEEYRLQESGVNKQSPVAAHEPVEKIRCINLNYGEYESYSCEKICATRHKAEYIATHDIEDENGHLKIIWLPNPKDVFMALRYQYDLQKAKANKQSE